MPTLSRRVRVDRYDRTSSDIIGRAVADSAIISPGAPPLAAAPTRRLPALDGVRAIALIGVLFGYLPARAAARLDPVTALARD